MTDLAQDVLLDLVVVDVREPIGLLAAHLLHLGPLEELIGPPDGLRFRVPVLGSLPAVGGPDQPREVGPGLGGLHLAQRLRQHRDSVTLEIWENDLNPYLGLNKQ